MTTLRKSTIKAVFALLLTAAAAFGQVLEIHHVNVGQGDATLVIGPDNTVVLIDGGDNGRGSGVVLPYLDRLGIEAVDYVIATHMHADHIGGLDEVMAGGLDIGVVLDNGSSSSSTSYADYAAAAANFASSRRTIAVGEVINLGKGATATCIYRNGQGVGGDFSVSEENDRSVCLLIDYDNFQYFIGGDIGGGGSNYFDVEGFVAPSVGDVDVLRVNHHGSSNSSNNTFLAALAPEAAIISVGSNSYGHPSASALDRLYNAGSDVIQTGCGDNPCGKVMGHVKIVVKKGGKYWVNGSKRKKDEFIRRKNQPPVADFTYSISNRTVALDASACRDEGKIKHYFWNFGDGTTMSGRKLCKVSHSYGSEGNYTVFFSALDKFGASGIAAKTFFVGIKKSIDVSAYASPSNPKRYSHVKIYVTVTDQLGKPVQGASVKTVAHYKTTDTTHYGTTGSDGKSTIDYYISSATVGYMVVVSVTASFGGLSATTSTSFTPSS